MLKLLSPWRGWPGLTSDPHPARAAPRLNPGSFYNDVFNYTGSQNQPISFEPHHL
jgi:hypothetical protein